MASMTGKRQDRLTSTKVRASQLGVQVTRRLVLRWTRNDMRFVCVERRRRSTNNLFYFMRCLPTEASSYDCVKRVELLPSRGLQSNMLLAAECAPLGHKIIKFYGFANLCFV